MLDNVQNKLDMLLKIYSKNLPDKINHLETQWKELLQNWDLMRAEDFHREAHSLCGSSGTYGYSELSKVSRQLEIFLKTLLKKQVPSREEQRKVTDLLSTLQLTLAQRLPEKIADLGIKPTELSENKNVYILEQEEKLSQQIRETLKQTGYEPYLIKDWIVLAMAVEEKAPLAIIIDTDFLDEESIRLIVDLQKKQPIPFQLFCILPNGELLPRLEAIRAGCQAFFQKPIDLTHLIQVFTDKCNIYANEPYRILIIDDSKTLADYYCLILNQAGMTAQAITNPMDLLKKLETFQPNLLLMDVYMPECTGFELAAVLRQEQNYTKIPIIFLSTEEDKDKKLFALSLGGDDYLTKPIAPQHLISTIRSRSKRAGILNYYMTTDSLTGLLNHSSILRQLDLHILRAIQTDVHGTCVMIDIDGFKKINDTYGHPIGDRVIKKLANLLSTRLRLQDSVGRYGGEEFVLIIPGATIVDSKKIVNQLRVKFSQCCFTANEDFFVTFSAGISFWDAKANASRVIEQADQSLYKAKSTGRNKVVIFDPRQ